MNFDDVSAVLANWETDALDGDADYDGFVGFDDMNAVIANFDD